MNDYENAASWINRYNMLLLKESWGSNTCYEWYSLPHGDDWLEYYIPEKKKMILGCWSYFVTRKIEPNGSLTNLRLVEWENHRKKKKVLWVTSKEKLVKTYLILTMNELMDALSSV